MTNLALTKEDKQCLQLWFRQAIAQVERDEALDRLLKEQAKSKSVHHNIAARRRPARRAVGTHSKELTV
jgi:hypothetical protein